MVHDGVNWRMKTRRAALILSAALLPLMAFAASAVHAQSIMRTPSLHIDSRTPTINPTVAPRINPTIAGRAADVVSGADRPSRGRRRPATAPRVRRYASPRRAPACRLDASLCALFAQPLSGLRICLSRPRRRMFRSSGDVGRRRQRQRSAKKGNGGPRNNAAQAAINLRAVQNEFVAEIDGALSTAQADELARRHGLERIASQNFPLLGGTIGLFRIIDRRPVDTVRREFAADGSVNRCSSISVTCCRIRRSRRPRAIPRNMRSPSFGCRRRTRSPAA